MGKLTNAQALLGRMLDAEWRRTHPNESKQRALEVSRRRVAATRGREKSAMQYERDTCGDRYIRDQYRLTKDAPQEVVEVYRTILQIKRELRK